MQVTTKGFSARAFTAILMAISCALLPISGFYNHVYAFSPMTAERHGWMFGHNVLGILFIGSASWHIVLNRRLLGKYLKGIGTGLPTVSREAVAACAIVGLLALLSVRHGLH